MAFFNLSNASNIFPNLEDNSDDDTILGNGGDDEIEAGTGSDFAFGGTGDDILYSYDAAAAFTFFDGDGEDDFLYGDSGDDSLYGDANADQLDGGTGNDFMAGLDGDDTYFVDSLGDIVSETRSGYDKVFSTISHTLGANLEELELLGGLNASGSGNGLANVITGNSGNNNLDGKGGNDVILGEEGNDTLKGGSGNDELGASIGQDLVRGQSGNDIIRGGLDADVCIGGTGRDTFQWLAANQSTPGARDIIRAGDGAVAFEGAGNAVGDVIDLSLIFGGVLTFGGRVTLSNSGANTLVRANTDNDGAIEFEVLIEDGGVLASAYRAADFIL